MQPNHFGFRPYGNRVLVKRWPETEVIVVTGEAEEDEAVSWAIEAIKGGDDFVEVSESK